MSAGRVRAGGRGGSGAAGVGLAAPLAALLALLALGACAEPADSACAGVSLPQAVLVLEREGEVSALGRIDEQGCLSEVASLEFGGDPALALRRGRAFVLLRDRGLVREVDPSTLAVVRSFAAFSPDEPPPRCDAPGCHNPHDLALDDEGRAWITRYDSDALAIVDPEGGALERVELGDLADGDGFPEMEGVSIEGGRAFVSLEFLDFDAPGQPATRPGALAVLDVASRARLGLVDLGGRNPFGPMAAAPGERPRISVALPGAFHEVDDVPGRDGIALVDLELAAAGEASAVRPILDEAAAGGSPTEVVVVSETEAYAIVAGPAPDVNPTRVLRFDPGRGIVTGVLADASLEGEPGFYHAGLAAIGDPSRGERALLLVGDRRPGRARILFFDRSSLELAAEVPVRRYAPLSLAPAPR